MFGNSGRSPMYCHLTKPYIFDFEEMIKVMNMNAKLINELECNYVRFWFKKFYHPNREDRDDMII